MLQGRRAAAACRVRRAGHGLTNASATSVRSGFGTFDHDLSR